MNSRIEVQQLKLFVAAHDVMREVSYPRRFHWTEESAIDYKETSRRF